MARRGRFRGRRQGSNLTLLIAQLVREQRAAEDRAIFDAYRNGGQFQGAAVTDQRLLDYIKNRRDGFTKDDPLWDQWNNTFIQTNFSIGEQKIGLAFKEGRVSAAAVANFYRSQLASIPKDSAFYREVAGRAAEWAKSAAAAGRASAKAALNKQIEAAQKVYFDTFNAYSMIEEAIATAARQRGLIAGNQDVTAADASSLQLVLDSGAVIGPDGTPITYAEWQQATVAAHGSIQKIINLGEQAGYKYDEWRNQQDRLWTHIADINALDDRSLYEAAQAQWAKDIADAGGDPYATAEANKKYLASLTKLRDTALKASGTDTNNADFIGGLENEIKALSGEQPNGPTVLDLYSGGSNDHGANIYAGTQALTEDIKALDKGKAYLGQAEPGGDLAVIPFGPGQFVDEQGQIAGLDPSIQAAVTEVNGVKRTVYLRGTPITAATFIDVATGQPVPASEVTRDRLNSGQIAQINTTNPTVGYVFADPNGTLSYGVIQPDGSMIFTKTNPFRSLTASDGGYVTVADAITQTVTKPGGKEEDVLVPDVTSVTTGNVNGTFVITGESVSNREILRLVDEGKVGASEQQYQQLVSAVRRDQSNVNLRRNRSFGEETEPNPLSTMLRDFQQSGIGQGLKLLFDTTLSAARTQGNGTGLSASSTIDRPPSLTPPPPPPTVSPTTTLTSGLVTSPTMPDPTLTEEDYRDPADLDSSTSDLRGGGTGAGSKLL